jgi:hypothetical protein
MNIKIYLRVLPVALGALAGGCTTNGYITSSVSTVLGLDVSENPKTQIPHIKFGYARSGLYYVPTGKTAYGDPHQQGAGDAVANRDSVKDTPEVVSEIFVNSKFLTDITISEKFAIGPAAVDSHAAVATLGNPAAQAVATNGTINAAPTSVVLPTKVVTEKVPDETLKARINDVIKARQQNLDAIREAIYAAEKNAKPPVDYGMLMARAPDTLPRTSNGFTQWVDRLQDAGQLRTILNEVAALPR